MLKTFAFLMYGALSYSLGSLLASASLKHDAAFVFWILVLPIVIISKMIVWTFYRSLELKISLPDSIRQEFFELKSSSKSLLLQSYALLSIRQKSFGPFVDLRLSYDGGGFVWKATGTGSGSVDKFQIVMDIESGSPTTAQADFARYFSENATEIRNACEMKISQTGRSFTGPLAISSVAVPVCGKMNDEWSVLLIDAVTNVHYLVGFSNGSPSSVDDSS